MLIVGGVVCAALTAWGFLVLHEIGHRDKMPVWLESWGGFEIMIPVLIAGIIGTGLLPSLFFKYYETETFGAREGILAALAAVLGIAGIWAIRWDRKRRAARHAAPVRHVVVSNEAAPAGQPNPDPRPKRPTGAAGQRRRKAA